MRWVVVLAAALLAGVLVYTLGVFDDGSSTDPVAAIGPDGDVTGLEGRADEAAVDIDPYAEITDWREMVKALQGVHEVDPRWNERVVALAESDPTIVDELIEALRERYDADRETTGLHVVWVQQALAALGGGAVPKMVVALEDNEAVLRERVIGVLLVLGPDAAPAIPIAMRTAKNEGADVYERGWMISLLGTIGPKSKEILPYLHAMLRHEDAEEYLEETGVVALYRIDGASADVIETYSIILGGQWFSVRASILQIIIDDLKGKAAPLVLDVLAILDDDSNDRMHPQAVRALQAIGKGDPSVVAKLGEWVEDPPYRDARVSACVALAKLGPEGQRRLAQAVDPEDEDLLSEAVLQLSDNGAPAVLLLPLLPPLLESKWEWRRQHGLMALARTPSDATETWPWIERALHSDVPGDRGAAGAAIFALRDPPKAALDHLDAVLSAEFEEGEPFDETQTATLSLVDLRAVTNDDLERRFLAMLSSEQPNIRYGVTWALRTAPLDLEERAIGLLVDRARAKDHQVTGIAVESLVEMSRRSEAARETLIRLRKTFEKDPERRYYVFHIDYALQNR